MVFRLPTPFDSLRPLPPAPLQRRLWRGSFRFTDTNLFNGSNGTQELFVASAETEGDK